MHRRTIFILLWSEGMAPRCTRGIGTTEPVAVAHTIRRQRIGQQ